MNTPEPPKNAYLDLVTALAAAVTFAWRNKAATVFALVLAGGGYALYSQGAAIVEGVAQLRTITRPAPAVEAERAVGEQSVNEVLVPAFEETRLVTDADRVSFYSGHNNSGGLGGDHWVCYDLRQVAAADGVLVDEAGR